MLNLKRLCVLGLLWVCPRTSAAASYYVSASGTDANAGTLSAPWKTLARASRAVLHPGDVLLLRGGDVFRESFSVEAADAGTDANPISITAYGSGRAVIAPLSGSGISVYNAGGYRIAHLAIVGAGDAASGIVFFADVPGGVKLPSVMMDDVEVSGFGSDGIEIGSWNGATGYRNVRITRASVHGNARSGLIVYAQQPNVHEDVYIGDTRAFANSGIAGSPTNSGSGIVLGSVNRGTVERSVASGNGWLCSATEGPVGIWTYDSTFVTIQHNESYGNRTGGPADGGGFDLDQNVSHSVVQFNYSHGNAGAGYLLAQGPATSTHHSNVVRFNVSENDGRKNRYAGIELWGRVLAAEIYNNTIFVAASASGTPRAVYVSNVGVPASTPAHVHIRNNILQTDGSAPLIDVAAGVLGGSPDIRFEGNVYDPSGGAFHVLWGSSSYSSLSAWRATTQETIAGAAVGTTVDPLLTAPGSGQTAGDATKLESLRAYELRIGSPVASAGLDLRARFAIDDGGVDLFGTHLGNTARPIGASRSSAARPAADVIRTAADASVVAGAWRTIGDATAAGGLRLWNPNTGAPKLAQPFAAPANFVDIAFAAEAGRPYRLWIRAKADANSWANDSVFVQFSGAVDASGAAIWRMGTTSAASITLEDCTGCGLIGWGWQDAAVGIAAPGPVVYFSTTGPQTLRLQPREDGLSIDQIVLSPRTFLLRSPGAVRNDQTIVPPP